MDIEGIISEVSVERVKGYLKAIEGFRHAWGNYEALGERAAFIEDTLRSIGFPVERQEVDFYGRSYRNIIATMKGSDDEKGWILIGSHYDAAWGSPGADDNASGVAVILEAARVLRGVRPRRTVQFVAFTLEEPQPQTIRFLTGSSRFVEEARRLKRRYDGAFILESVGYTSMAEGSQVVPALVRTPVPTRGDFLAVIANRRSRFVMKSFHNIAKEHVPELPIVPYRVPLSGYLIPESRFSDHAPFWDKGYPALMLTDTAMFRNPYYHTPFDRFETLDLGFIANVTKAMVAAAIFLP